MTRYIILRQRDEKDSLDWTHVGTVDAASARSALSEHLRVAATNGEANGTYATVPARSWDPVKVEAKQAFSFS